MTGVMTVVSAQIAMDRVDKLTETFREAVRHGMPERHRAMLLRGDGDLWSIVSTWRSRADLDAYLTSTDEPFALRILLAAGGDPVVQVMDIVVDSDLPWWP